MEKASAKDEERFNKAVEIYAKKYNLTIYSLIKFIEEKIAVSPETKNIILAEILNNRSREEAITKEQLKMYLHMVAAAQTKVDIRGKKIESFHHFYRLAFKENKSKEEGKPTPDAKGERKEENGDRKKEAEITDHQLKKEKTP
jgi:tRNA G10  N-methylase Trm11